MKLQILQNIKAKYPIFRYIFIFLIIIVVPVFLLKIYGGLFGNNFATIYSSTSNSPTYGTDNSVNTIVPDTSGGVYIGGTFTFVGPYTGSGVPILASTGSTTSTFPKVIYDVNTSLTSTVNTAIPDGSGGWYIGGFFFQVGTVARNHIAHILSDGSVDPGFNPNVASVGQVDTMVLSTSTNTLYFGGVFQTINGSIARNRIAAVNATSGVATTFDPNVNAQVRTIVLSPDGSTLYLGGSFTTVNNATTTRNRIAAVNTSDGLVTTFNPNLANDAFTLALSSDGGTLYIGGSFITINGGTSRNRIAAVSTSTGTATGFNPNAGGQVNSIVLSTDGGTLYMGGQFITINGATSRTRIAAVSTSTGTATSFDPGTNNIVSTIALSSDGSTLYFGGQFTTVGTTTITTRTRLAAVNTSTGIPTIFNPNTNNTVNTLALSLDGNTLYVGGQFNLLNGTLRNRIAHILSDGSVDPNFDPNASGQVNTLFLSTSTNTLYMGGAFTTVNTATTRNRIAAVNASTGILTAFNPNASGQVFALALSPDGNTLYMGGSFTTVNTATTTRNRLAAVGTATGLVTIFDPNANSTVFTTTLSPDGSILYTGGQFTTMNNATTTRNRLAAVNTSDGLVTTFDPNVNTGGVVNTTVISSDGGTIYLGGTFTIINGATTRNRIAAVSSSTGLVTTFNPNANGTVSALALSLDGNTLYLGGSFLAVNGNFASTTRNRIAAVNASTGILTAFNPNANAQVLSFALSPDENTLYVGGDFTIISGIYQLRLVSFPRADPIITTDTLTTIGKTTATLLGNITSVGLSSLTERGFHYGTSSQSLSSSTSQTSGLGTGVYSISIPGLTCNTTYSYQAYAINSFGESDGVIRTFTTSACSTHLPTSYSTTTSTTTTITTIIISTTTISIATTTPIIATTTPVVATTTSTTTKPIPPIIPVVIKPTIKPVIPKPTGLTLPNIPTSGSSNEPTTVSGGVTNTEPSISNDFLSNVGENIKQSYEQAVIVVAEAVQKVSDAVNSPTGSIVTKAVSTTGIVLGASVSIGTLAFANPITFSEVWLIPSRLFGLMVGALGIRKKKRAWGTVYDSVTKRPIDPAYVTLIDSVTNKQVDMAITDLDGRYGFLVTPGTYKIVAAKTNYSFPSQKMQNITFDEVYNDIYHGSNIIVSTAGDIITKNIPMDSLSFDWNEFTKNKRNINTFVNGTDVTWAKISKTVFTIGAVASVTALIFAPRPYNLIIAIFYVIAYIFNYLVFQVKKTGMITEKSTHLPLSFAIVKIFREGMADTPMIKKIADKEGKYYALLPKGNYVIQIDKKNDDGSYTQVYKSDTLTFDSGVINQDVEV